MYQRFHGEYKTTSSATTSCVLRLLLASIPTNIHTDKGKKEFQERLAHQNVFLSVPQWTRTQLQNFIIIVIITKRQASFFVKIIFTTLRRD